MTVAIRGWLSEMEADCLTQLAAGSRVLEIGTWCGLSALVMAESAKQIVCVDHWNGDAACGREDTLEEFRRNVAAAHSPCDILPFVASLESAIPLLNLSAFGLVFYDADHSYESTRNGLALLAEGGLRSECVLACHDYRQGYDGVIDAVNEFAESTGRTIRHCGSLAILESPR